MRSMPTTVAGFDNPSILEAFEAVFEALRLVLEEEERSGIPHKGRLNLRK